MIEKISSNVAEVKTKHSEILSAPQTDDRMSLSLSLALSPVLFSSIPTSHILSFFSFHFVRLLFCTRTRSSVNSRGFHLSVAQQLVTLHL